MSPPEHGFTDETVISTAELNLETNTVNVDETMKSSNANSKTSPIVATEEDEELSDLLSKARIITEDSSNENTSARSSPLPSPTPSPPALASRRQSLQSQQSHQSQPLARVPSKQQRKKGILKQRRCSGLGDSTSTVCSRSSRMTQDQFSNSIGGSQGQGLSKVASTVSFQRESLASGTSKNANDTDSIATDASHQNQLKKSSSVVSFASVNIREYDRTIGDNPSCHYGIPVSLDWSYSEEWSHNLDDYEKIRKRTLKKTKSALYLNARTRESIVKMNLGYSDEEIAANKKERKKIQRSRSMTDIISPLWRVEHAAQSAMRKIKRRLGKKRTRPLSPYEASLKDYTENSSSHSYELDLGNHFCSYDLNVEDEYEVQDAMDDEAGRATPPPPPQSQDVVVSPLPVLDIVNEHNCDITQSQGQGDNGIGDVKRKPTQTIMFDRSWGGESYQSMDDTLQF